MTISVVTAAAYLPVSLAQARVWARLESDYTTEDGLLTQLIQAMVNYAETYTARAFIQRTLKLTLPAWPSDLQISLPYAPLLGVDSVKYLDADSIEQTLAADQWQVDSAAEPAVIFPAHNADAWPSTLSVRNAVRITYRAGYAAVGSPDDEGAHQTGQPAELKVWLQARVATLFAQREQLVMRQAFEIPRTFADGLLDPLVMGERLA